MSKSNIEFLRHALDEIEFLEKEREHTTEEKFMYDELLQRAFARSVEIIGEAIKQVPDMIKQKHTDIDWKSYAGLRDKLIHHYFGVDYAIVWDVVIHELPDLKQKLLMVLQTETHQ